MTDGGEPSAKQLWRDRISTTRRASGVAERRVEAELLTAAVGALVGPDDVACAYVPVGREPGSLGLLDALHDAGARVLLPVTAASGPLSWGWYTGSADLVRARFGLREPAGPALPPTAIRTAGLILIPALAVDRRGVRLGRGAGYYDRSLPLADPSARLVAVVRDDELVPELPEDPHDRRVGWALTPRAGPSRLGP